MLKLKFFLNAILIGLCSQAVYAQSCEQAQQAYQQLLTPSTDQYNDVVQFCGKKSTFHQQYASQLQALGRDDLALISYTHALQNLRNNELNKELAIKVEMMRINLKQQNRVASYLDQQYLLRLQKEYAVLTSAQFEDTVNPLLQQLNDMITNQPLTGSELQQLSGESRRDFGVEAVEISYQIPFDYNATQPNVAGMRLITEAAQAFVHAGFSRIQAIGHTDQRGDAAYNQRLSEKRAQAVFVLMIGAQPTLVGKLSASGMGENQLISQAENEAAYQLNRRVSFVLQP